MAYEFDFAISFARETREIAKKLAELLSSMGARVFYDRYYTARLFGRNLNTEFPYVYGKATRYFVPIISADYAWRDWPQFEWAIARAERKARVEEFILPLRVDGTHLIGLPDTLGYLDLRETSLENAAAIFCQKLEDAEGVPRSRPRKQTWVATFGVLMEDLHKGLLPKEAPSDYVHLCDWLTDDLMQRLDRTDLQSLQAVDDARNGETFSLGVAFDWDPNKGALDFGDIEWWELLELLPYDEVYESPAR